MSFSLPLQLLAHFQLVIFTSTTDSKKQTSFDLRPLQLDQLASTSNSCSSPSTINIKAIETKDGITFELTGADSPAASPLMGTSTPPEFHIEAAQPPSWQNTPTPEAESFFDLNQWLNGQPTEEQSLSSTQIPEYSQASEPIAYLEAGSPCSAEIKAEVLCSSSSIHSHSPQSSTSPLPPPISMLSPPFQLPYTQTQSTSFQHHIDMQTPNMAVDEVSPSVSPSISPLVSPSHSPSSLETHSSILDFSNDSMRSISPSHTKRRIAQQRPRPFRCIEPGCDRVFTSNYTRETHMLTHRPKQKQSYQCTVGCGAFFSRKHDRFRHEVSQHGKPTQWTCARCSQYFSSEKLLSVHSCDRPARYHWRPQSSEE
ncbi:hypothetical protein Moror_2471 [Moniliophthora roreri MCA 2997]|uniref:C2H2-type domain-containing protein n=2 Tax=Moniliophthora roreri TaxID=221103 RepID=V2WZY0_MONRO|nr:hypothetical protein Moror_2471 [Moniliophthora roreri MCA 2997]